MIPSPSGRRGGCAFAVRVRNDDRPRPTLAVRILGTWIPRAFAALGFAAALYLFAFAIALT